MLPFRSPMFSKGGGGANPDAHTYWRISTTSNHGGVDNLVGFGNIEMRETIGGPQAATGGTATASSTSSGYSATEAFNGTIAGGDAWVSNTGPTEWIKYEFPSAVEIVELAINPLTASAAQLLQTARECTLEWSDDDVSWTEAFSFVVPVPLPFTTVAQAYTFPETLAAGEHYWWRLRSTVNNGASNLTAFGEVYFRESAAGPQVVPTRTSDAANVNGWNKNDAIFSGGYEGYKAFNNVLGAVTNGFASSGGGDAWIAFGFPDPKAIVEVAVYFPSSGVVASQAPKSMLLEYSDDGGFTWSLDTTFQDETGWSLGSTRTLVPV